MAEQQAIGMACCYKASAKKLSPKSKQQNPYSDCLDVTRIHLYRDEWLETMMQAADSRRSYAHLGICRRGRSPEPPPDILALPSGRPKAAGS